MFGRRAGDEVSKKKREFILSINARKVPNALQTLFIHSLSSSTSNGIEVQAKNIGLLAEWPTQG